MDDSLTQIKSILRLVKSGWVGKKDTIVGTCLSLIKGNKYLLVIKLSSNLTIIDTQNATFDSINSLLNKIKEIAKEEGFEILLMSPSRIKLRYPPSSLSKKAKAPEIQQYILQHIQNNQSSEDVSINDNEISIDIFSLANKYNVSEMTVMRAIYAVMKHLQVEDYLRLRGKVKLKLKKQ